MNLSVTILLLSLSWTQLLGQPTGNVLSRVMQIRTPHSGTGTAFILDYEDRQYIVTANHMVEQDGARAKIEIFGRDAQWHAFEFTILHGANSCTDVAVLVPSEKRLTLAEAIPYPLNYAMGQEAYFLGFPYGLFTSFAGQQMVVPLVKHAYISAKVGCDAIFPNGSKDDTLLLLDRLNNPGFSGGPVVAPDVFATVHTLKLVGVISGYKPEHMPLNINGQSTSNASIATNSGIIVAIPIQRVVELITTYLATSPSATVK